MGGKVANHNHSFDSFCELACYFLPLFSTFVQKCPKGVISVIKSNGKTLMHKQTANVAVLWKNCKRPISALWFIWICHHVCHRRCSGDIFAGHMEIIKSWIDCPLLVQSIQIRTNQRLSQVTNHPNLWIWDGIDKQTAIGGKWREFQVAFRTLERKVQV